MLSLSPATRVFVATAPVDWRGSFNALAARVHTQLQHDPLSGHLFVFTNTRRHQTTFNIPIGHCNHCLPVASTARTAVAGSPAKGTERDRGH